MNRSDFLIKAVTLLDAAVIEDGIGEPVLCIANLVKLRELLNARPELEAGGAINRCRVCHCTDANACPGSCHWVKPDLCSNCV